MPRKKNRHRAGVWYADDDFANRNPQEDHPARVGDLQRDLNARIAVAELVLGSSIEFDPIPDPRFRVRFDQLASEAMRRSRRKADPATIAKIAKRAREHYNLLKNRFDAWTAEIAAEAAIAQAIEDHRRGDIEEDLRTIAKQLGGKLPVPATARRNLIERLNAMPAAVLPWERGGNRGPDTPDAPRRKKRESEERGLIDELRADTKEKLPRKMNVTGENVERTMVAIHFDQETQNKTRRTQGYDRLEAKSEGERVSLRVRKHRLVKRKRS